MFTMTVAIVGAGVLALPYAVEQVREGSVGRSRCWLVCRWRQEEVVVILCVHG